MISVRQFARQNPGLVRRDLDAMNEGWDPAEYVDDSELYRAYVGAAGIEQGSDEDADVIDQVLDVLGWEG